MKGLIQIARGPARESVSRDQAEKGYSLIELMIVTVLVVILFCGYILFLSRANFKKESYRRAAIEVGAGILDVIGEFNASGSIQTNRWTPDRFHTLLISEAMDTVRFTLIGTTNSSPQPLPFLPQESRIFYTLLVTQDVENASWATPDYPLTPRWAILRLYDQNSLNAKPFCEFRQLLQMRAP